MSYCIDIRVKVENKPKYVCLHNEYDPNITWNVRELIKQSSGWEIENEASNGLVTEWIKKIDKGIEELTNNPDKYKQYEATNGWGTVESTLGFYNMCRKMFENFMLWNEELSDVAVVWVS